VILAIRHPHARGLLQDIQVQKELIVFRRLQAHPVFDRQRSTSLLRRQHDVEDSGQQPERRFCAVSDCHLYRDGGSGFVLTTSSLQAFPRNSELRFTSPFVV